MDDKKRIKEELSAIFLELQLNKITEKRKTELQERRKKLDTEYKKILLDEIRKTK